MKDAFFELSSDFMAIGPSGATRWTAINPALATRLGLSSDGASSAEFIDSSDPSRLVASDGSTVNVDWTIREEAGLALWVGREPPPNLVRDLHHRLKNHFQFVLSLLSFQGARLQSEEAHREFAKAESRVRAVARLHESAYSSSDFGEVEFAAYLRQLVRDLASDGSVAVTFDATDVVLNMQQAVPLALIAHEWIADALSDERVQTVAVSLKYEGERSLCLIIARAESSWQAVSAPTYDSELVNLFIEQLGAAPVVRSMGGKHLAVTLVLPAD